MNQDMLIKGMNIRMKAAIESSGKGKLDVPTPPIGIEIQTEENSRKSSGETSLSLQNVLLRAQDLDVFVTLALISKGWE